MTILRDRVWKDESEVKEVAWVEPSSNSTGVLVRREETYSVLGVGSTGRKGHRRTHGEGCHLQVQERSLKTNQTW